MVELAVCNLLSAPTYSISNTGVKLLSKSCNWIIDQGTKQSISCIRCRSVFKWTCTLNSTMPRVNGINSVCNSILGFLKQLVTSAPLTYSITNKVWDSEHAMHNAHEPHSITIQAYWLYFKLKISVSELQVIQKMPQALLCFSLSHTQWFMLLNTD